MPGLLYCYIASGACKMENKDLKKPLSFEQQIDRLIAHNMEIRSKRDAAAFLANVNYYRFTGYALQFRSENGQDYIEKTNFDTVKNIYLCDEELRGVLRDALDTAEAMLRTKIAYGFAISKCKEPPYDGHYDASNFVNKEMHKDVLASLQKEENRRIDSLIVQHHKAKYNDRMPLWVMVELLSFSSLSTLYYAMYFSEQDSIAASCKKTRTVMINHMHVLSVLRNKCCHGGRLYNSVFHPSAQLGASYLRNHPEVKVDTVFAAILVLFRTLPNRESKQRLHAKLCNCIQRYASSIDLGCLGFPENYLQLMNIELNSL